MEFLDLAKKRYSCRKFSSRKVEKELLDKIVKAAIVAPTAVNTQPFKIWAMESESSKEKIHQVTSYTFGAQTFLVIGYKNENAWVRKFDNRNFAEVDASIAATHMMMEIADLGLATTWVGYFDAPKLQQLCPQMAGYELIALFPIGYADQGKEGQPSPKHDIRKNEEELFEVL